MKSITVLLALLLSPGGAAVPCDAMPLEAAEWPQNCRLHVEFSAPSQDALRLAPGLVVPLPENVEHDVAVEHPATGTPVLRVQPDAFAFKVWSLRRTADYCSKHYDEHPLPITAASLDPDHRTVTLDIPAPAPTQCHARMVRLRAPDGAAIGRPIHSTIHVLSER